MQEEPQRTNLLQASALEDMASKQSDTRGTTDGKLLFPGRAQAADGHYLITGEPQA